MKKLIAILTVMFVIAGAIFATAPENETHTLRVQSTVGEHLPAFQMRFETGRTITVDPTYGTVEVTATNQTATTNSDASAYNRNVAGTETQDTIYDIGWDLSAPGTHTATFKVYLVQSNGNSAKTKRTFSLTFSNGAFTGLTVRNTPIDNIVPTIVASGVQAFTGITSSTADQQVAGKVDVIFNGKTCPTADTEVASAVYTWTGNEDLDMGT